MLGAHTGTQNSKNLQQLKILQKKVLKTIRFCLKQYPTTSFTPILAF